MMMSSLLHSGGGGRAKYRVLESVCSVGEHRPVAPPLGANREPLLRRAAARLGYVPRKAFR